MESTTSRLILSGTEYDYLFPKARYQDETIKPNADVYDTVEFIKSIIPKTLGDTRRLVEEVLWDKDLKKFCSKAWNFAYHHIPYKRDEDGIEQVRRPSRSWADRHHGGIDCDCYSVFLGSCLFNAGVKFHFRITKYPKEKGETPYWQHIYIAVPKNQNAGYSMDRREDFYILDCVKDRFNSEEPYLEFKDYPMRLDYLNGLDSGKEYKIPSNVDAQDLADTNDIDELGELGEWRQTEGFGKGPKKSKAEKKEKRKAFFKKGLKVFNKVLNPATIALRNSVLLAMKVNFLKVASKIRFGYLSDAQANQMGLDMGKFAHLKKITEKVEKIYEKAGGKAQNFRKAILKGHGNKDHKVPMTLLAGFGELYGEDLQDDEYKILRAREVRGLQEVYGLGGLGVAPLAAPLALAASALAPIVKALSTVKGMFPKKSGGDAQEFDSTANTNETPPIVTDQMLQETKKETSQEDTSQTNEPTSTSNITPTDTTSVTTASKDSTDTTTTNSDATTNSPVDSSPGMLAKAIDLVRQHPIPATIIASVVTVGLYKFLTRSSGSALGGFPSRKKKPRKGKKRKEKSGSKKAGATHKKIFAVQLR